MTLDELKRTIEALIFVSEDPITFRQIKEALAGEDPDSVEYGLKQLVLEFNGRNGGLEIRELAGGPGNARRNRLQAAGHDPRDHGGPRHALGLGH